MPALGVLLSGVGTGEQITQRPPSPQRQPDPAPVLRPVVQQMAPLAQGPDVAVPPPAMGGILVEMCCRQHDLGGPDRHIREQGRRGDPAAPAVAPGLPLLVPPAAVGPGGAPWRHAAGHTPGRPLARTNRTQWLTCGQSIG